MVRIATAPLLAPALLTAVLYGLVGCASAAPAELPDGVQVSVHQNRPDTEDRRLQVRIVNGSASALTVNALSFSSPRFSEPAPYAKAPSTIRAGGTLDLPISLPEPVCGDDGPANETVEVRLEYALESGQTGDVVVVPDDPLDQLDGISERDCFQHSMDAIAELGEPDQIRIEQADGRLVAFVDLAVTPTGAPGSFTIESVDDTVLFGLFDPSSATPRDSLRIDLTVTGSDAPDRLTIPLVPARCDAHAVAEDKRGTLLPLRVRVGDATGIRYFALSDDRKGELYSYLNDACTQR
jgi:hypothetical protein